MNGQHKAQSSQNRDHTGKQLRKTDQQSFCELVHIGNHPAYNIPMAMTIHIFQRKDLDFIKGFLPNIPDHMIGDLIVADIHQPLNQGSCQDDNQHLLHDLEK